MTRPQTISSRASMQIGSDFFKQKTGIPQGSKVSSLLCTLYYGHMERCRLSFLNKESSVGPLHRLSVFRLTRHI